MGIDYGELTIALGETTQFRYEFSIPDSYVDTVFDKMESWANSITGGFQVLPDKETIRSWISSLSPTLQIDYTAEGNCEDICKSTITHVQLPLEGLSSVGFTAFSIKVNLVLTCIVTQQAYQCREEEECETCEALAWRQVLLEHAEKIEEWHEGGEEGERPKLPEKPEFEDMGVGHRCRTFGIKWYLSGSLADFNYTWKLDDSTQSVCTCCCPKNE